MPRPLLDDSYAPEVRANVGLLAFARFAGNTVYRFAAPFLATIAAGLGVSLGRLGVALAIGELVTLSAPLIGRVVDAAPRRAAMVTGLTIVAVGATVTGTAQALPQFVVGLCLLSLGKVGYDISLGAWIADRVPWERRSRVIGLTEIAWSASLLLGVSLLGALLALTSWHVAYVTGAVIVLLAAVSVLRHLPHEPARHAHHAASASSARRAAWPVVVTTCLSMALLACSSQFLFVTYGSWLDDHFGFSAGGIAVVTFGLGVLELVAGVVSVGRTDRWGKERCVLIGTSVMAPAAVLVVLGSAHLWLLLPAFGVFLMGFELAIISGMPLGALLTPGKPATGLAILIGSVTCGRALTSIPATAWLESHGLRWPATGAVLAAVAAHLAMRLRHAVAQPSVTKPRLAEVTRPA